MSTHKTLFMLIGPKGSGKTHIGTLVNQHTDIVILRVEPIWLGLKPYEDGWKKVEAVIDAMFQEQDKVMTESLGIGEGFDKFRASLAKKIFHQDDPRVCRFRHLFYQGENKRFIEIEPLDGRRRTLSRFPQYLMKAILEWLWAVAVVIWR